MSHAVIEKLVDSHREFLTFLEKRVESKEVAEDILQAAFVRGLERSAEIHDEESVVAWFYRVLRNAVIDHYRRRGAAERAQERWTREFGPAEVPAPEIQKEICVCLVRLLDELKPEYKQALQEIDLEDGSLYKLATKEGITANNARVRLHRARVAMRKKVAECCGTCAGDGCSDCTCEYTPWKA